MKSKIATIITQLEFGGAQLHALYLCEGFARAGYENLLISGVRDYLDARADHLPATRHVNVEDMVRPINPIKDLKALIKIYRLLRKERPSAVYTHSSKAGILGRWAAFFAGVPVRVHTIHGYGITPLQSWPLRMLLLAAERMTSLITTHFVAVSQASIQKGLKWRLFRPEKVTLIRSGIELERFRRVRIDKEEKKRQLGLPPHSPVVGTVACFKPQKAPFDFVRAASIIASRMPRVNFIMVGDGQLRPKAEELAGQLGLEGKIFFLGWREDVEEIMATFDLFMLSSLWEGLPRVLPEACALGLPCVATWVDGNKEIIRDGYNGFLVPPSRPDLLAEAALKILQNPSLRKLFSQRAKKVSEEFSKERMIEDYLKLHRVLTAEGAESCGRE